MKARTDCVKCRKQMTQLSEENFLRHEYTIFENCVSTASDWAAALALSALKREGFDKEAIKRFFEDFCMLANLPEIFGKRITTTEVVKSLEKEFDISFDDIVVHHENVESFIKRYKQEQKEIKNGK